MNISIKGEILFKWATFCWIASISDKGKKPRKNQYNGKYSNTRLFFHKLTGPVINKKLVVFYVILMSAAKHAQAYDRKLYLNYQ